MENIMKSTKPRYDVLLAQLAYIKDKATERFTSSGNNKNEGLIDRTTDDLAYVCQRVDDSSTMCPAGYHREDGMCVPNLTS